MKFKILYFLALILLSISGFAQLKSSKQKALDFVKLTPQQRHKEKLRSMIPSPMVVESPKTRGGSRLIAYTTNLLITQSPPLYELSDTAHYGYNSNYGYDPTSEFFQINYTTEPPPSHNFENFYDTIKVWSYSPSVSSFILADSGINEFITNHKLANSKAYYPAYPLTYNYYLTYNASEKKISELDTILYMGTFIQKQEYAYDINGRVIETKYTDYDVASSTWTPTYIDSFTYDANGNYLSALTYTYNTSSSLWEKSDLINISYNTANKPILYIEKYWNTGTNSWTDDFRSIFVYNGANQMTSVTVSNWDILSTSWINNSKDSFMYGSLPYPSTRIVQLWDTSSMSFKDNNKYAYSYNTSNQIKSINYSNWKASSSSWVDTLKNDFYYENFNPQGIEETSISSGTLKVYPTPANNELSIIANWNEKQATSIVISDLLGNKLISMSLPSTKEIKQSFDISTLNSGIYLLSLHGEKGSITQKFTKL